MNNHPIPPLPTKPQKMQRFLQALLLHSDLVELEKTFRFPSISPAAWIKRLHPYLVRVAQKDPLTHISQIILGQDTVDMRQSMPHGENSWELEKSRFSPPARWGLLDFIRAHARLLLRLLLLLLLD